MKASRFGFLLVPMLLATAACHHAPAPDVAVEPPPPARLEVVPVPPGSVTPEAAMEAFIAPYREKLKVFDEPIGNATTTMDVIRRETPLGSWVCDALREQGSIAVGRPIDAVFVNSGGIRAALPQGPVSYNTILKILPFENTFVLLPMTGKELEVLAAKLASRKAAEPVSGLRIEADAEFRLRSVTVNGAPLDPTRTYLVATNSFLAAGAGGFEELSAMKQEDTGIILRDVVADYVKALAKAGRTVDPPAEAFRYRFDGKTVEELPK